MRKVILALFGLALSSFGVAVVFAGSAAAESSKFSQQILPINCVFQVIDAGSQKLIYLTPAECGQILPPPVPPTPTTPKMPQKQPLAPKPTPVFKPQRFSPFKTFSVPQTKIVQPPKTITIEPNQTFKTKGVELNKVKPGQTISFEVGQRNNGHRHSLEVSSIHKDYVVISFGAESEDSQLREGQEKQYNITGDSQKDIAVKVNKIKKDYVDLRIRQLNDTPTNYKARPPHKTAFISAIIAIIILLVVLAIFLSSWLGGNKLARRR